MSRLSQRATLSFVLLIAAEATPQSSSYGRLVGVARDAQGLALPGVSVTLDGGWVSLEAARASRTKRPLRSGSETSPGRRTLIATSRSSFKSTAR